MIKKILLCFFVCIILNVGLFIYYIHIEQNEKINSLLKENNKLASEIKELKEPECGVKHHGQLRIEGTNLVDSNGDLLQLRGVSSHGILWYPEYSNYNAISTTKRFGANAFRIAMYTEPSKGYINLPEDSMKAIRMAIENTLSADMYAIVDWHILKDSNPNIYVDDAIDFFDKISFLYANEPAIIYEICNEPNGDTSWEDIVKYSNKIIPVIRKNSPNALIIVGTPKYCTNLEEAVNNPLKFDNIMYSFHYYTGIGKDNYIDALDEATDKIPVFVSEWGISDELDGLKFASDFINYLKDKNISWINWSLTNKSEIYSLINPYCTHLGNWQEECLTGIGKFVFHNLKENK